MLAAAHLSVTRSHLSLHILAATHPHLLLMMLSIHLLLAMHHLLIRAMLALPGACLVGSFVVHPCLVSFSVLVIAVKIFSRVFISSVLGPTFFAMLFTAHACSLTLMVSDVSRPVLSSALFAMFFTTRSCSLALMLVP